MEEFKGGTEFFVLSEREGALLEWAGDSDDPTDLAFLIEEWLFGGGRPVDEPTTSRDEFDLIDDGDPGFEDLEIIVSHVLENRHGKVVVVFFTEDFGRIFGLKDFH